MSGSPASVVGANQDAIAEAGKMSIGANNVVAFMATGAGVREAYSAMSERVSASRRKAQGAI